MLHLIRRLRKNVINTGKLRRYTLYAIGEIVLVMIGILLALQINNWNKNRIQLNEEIKILNELKNDLNSNYVLINSIQDRLKISCDNSDSILFLLKNHIPYDKNTYPYAKMGGVLGFLGGHGGLFKPYNTSYKFIENYGMGIIRNDSLRIIVTDIYETSFNAIIFRETRHVDFITEQFGPFISDNFIFTQAENEFVDVTPINQKELENNQKFKNLLIKKRWYEKARINWLSALLLELDSLINQVDEEIIRLEKIKN